MPVFRRAVEIKLRTFVKDLPDHFHSSVVHAGQDAGEVEAPGRCGDRGLHRFRSRNREANS